MPLFLRRLIDRVLVTVCLLAGPVTVGCGWSPGGMVAELPLPTTGRPEPAEEAFPSLGARPSDTIADQSGADQSGDRAVLARRLDAEHRSVWIRSIPPWQESPWQESAEPEHRWRYPDLEELLARPAGRRPDWHSYLADSDPVVATNAAIALARSGDDSGAERLAEAARTPAVNQPMRCAAVEALATLKGPSVVPLLRELLQQYGQRAAEPGSTYYADLHAELIRGLARHVDPADDPHFVTALRSRARGVRLEALRAWSDGRGGSLPIEVADLRTDTDPEVRAAVMLALARRRHGEAQRYLAAALRDHELKVRTAAIGALGELGGRESRSAVERLLEDQPEAIRAAAVSALERMGAEEPLCRAANDRSWRVRVKVARALAGHPGCVAPARRLLQDPSAMVQHQVVLALATWPLDRAGPILLEAFGSRSLMTRHAAAEQLASRWSPATEFPVEGPPRRRQDVLDELQRRFRQQFGPSELASATEAATTRRPAPTITPQLLDQIEQLVRRRDVRALVDFGPGLVEGLERLVLDRQQLLPEEVYRDVLPRYGAVFVALDRLVSSDVFERRGAAGDLVELARRRPLDRLAVARLGQLVVAESDQLVWQDVLTAVAGDASEPSIRLGYAAISHPSAEVRRRACDHLAAHPNPSHARMLLPALEDRNLGVVRAAARALGTAGGLDDTQPLRQLLRSGSEDLRLDTAVALVRLGDPAGAASLQRLAYSSDPKIRRGVARAMGETADSTFIPTLIRLLDDRPAVCRAALEGLTKAVGHDVSASDDQSPATTSQRVLRWKQWFRHRLAAR